jgi:hypothetical protein
MLKKSVLEDQFPVGLENIANSLAGNSLDLMTLVREAVYYWS